jgi:O-antigen/teichoic acid export membrane protein
MASTKLKWFSRGFDSALSAGRSMIPPAINFAAAYLVIQLSGQSSWGQFVDVLIFTSLANMLIAFGIKDYVLRQASLQPGQIGSLIKSGTLVRLVVLVPSALVAFIFFPMQEAGWLTLWLIATLIYSGIDPLINFNRSYFKAIIAELTFGVFLFAYLTLVTVDQLQLVMAFAISAMLRSAVLLVFFRKTLVTGNIKFDLRLLLFGLPFLAMGLSGMLQSKTDLYLVAALLGDEELAIYQVTINFFIYLQAFSAFLVLPFAKNIYRLPTSVIWRLSLRFLSVGVLILTSSLPIIYLLTNHLYNFELTADFFIIGGFLVLPTFANLPMVYKLIGLKKERSVLYINLLGALINFICSYLMVPKLGIIGALIGSMIAKWTILFGYMLMLKVTTR